MIVRRTIDKDELKELPKVVFPGRIHVIQSESETEKAVAYLLSQPILGIDSETRPSFTKGQSHKVALLQISSEECCFLFRLNMTGLTQPLVDLLENPGIIKVGLSLKDDFMMLHKRAPFNQQSCIELQDYVRQFGIQDKSLQKIYAILFKEKISKSQRLSNWEADVLSDGQKQYAATDAWACLNIYNLLQELKRTGNYEIAPEDVLTNEDISKLVDTTDEWIMTRVGIKERRILKGEGLGTSYMGIRAVKQLLEKTNVNPEEIEVILTATTTPDHHFPTTSSIIAYHTGCKNAMTFDLQGACAGFLYALETGSNYIRSGRYKKVVVVAGDKMTAITDYQDRSTCPLFGDACGAVLLEPTTEEVGVMDTILRTDGVGYSHLIMKSGGSAYPPSHDTVDNREHFVFQDGKYVFKYAVSYMADVAAEIAERNGLTHDDIAWIVPHQANLRIIDATAKRLGVDMEKVMINIQKYGNTSAGTIPICLWEWEDKLKKGDNLILAAFGAGFTWGAIYLKWGYNGKQA